MTPPNDWEIKKCLAVCLSLLLAMLGLTGLDIIGFSIPGLQQITGFLFLAFVPGVLLLRVLRIHNLNVMESLLYTVGLSVAFVMVIGIILNFALPPFGILHPITVFPVITAMTIALLALGVVAYIKDKAFIPRSPPRESGEEETKARLGTKLNPFLLAILLPLLTILGASLVNSYQNNTILLILIFIITIIIGLVTFNRFIPSQVYPFMMAMIAISLLYQTTLISNYLVGSDIHEEYYYARLVLESSYWSASIASTVNSCLSIVMLAPVYSLLLNMDIVWLFKIIYPLFFCLVPLALYRIFRLQIGPRYAFLAAFFFISMPMFYMDVTQLARQQISELFFVLVVLLMVDRKLTLVQRTTLVLIFGIGVIASYYGLGIGYAIGYITFGMLVLAIIKSRPGRKLWQWLMGTNNSLPDDLTLKGAFNRKAIAIIISVSLFFLFAYYGTVVLEAVRSGAQIATGMTQGTIQIDPSTKESLVQTAIGLDFSTVSSGGKIWRILQYIVELCLIIGFFRLIFRPVTLGKLKTEYISLNIVSAIILLGIFILPAWFSNMGNVHAYGMGVTRIWHISLLITAPLFLFGGEMIVYGVMRTVSLFRKSTATLALRTSNPVFQCFVVLVVLIPYFIFNSGATFELSRSQTTSYIDMPYSIALSSYRLDLNTVYTDKDIAAARWISEVSGEETPVYADDNSNKLFINQVDFPCDIEEMPSSVNEISSPGYFYLRAWNVQEAMLTFSTAYAARQSISFDELSWFKETVKMADRIYDNGGAQVLMSD